MCSMNHRACHKTHSWSMLAIIIIYDCGMQNGFNDSMLLLCKTITALRWKEKG